MTYRGNYLGRVKVFNNTEQTASLGEGEIVKWEDPDGIGMDTPKILLDSGDTVYGCECWWVPIMVDGTRIEVHPTLDAINLRAQEYIRAHPYTAEWCKCEHPAFDCYPEDGACTCGIHKHHVHCQCGGVLQIG